VATVFSKVDGRASDRVHSETFYFYITSGL
jgi:hypothetical protein